MSNMDRKGQTDAQDIPMGRQNPIARTHTPIDGVLAFPSLGCCWSVWGGVVVVVVVVVMVVNGGLLTTFPRYF